MRMDSYPSQTVQVTDVIRLDEGTFTVFMPGEPFSYGVQDEKGPARVKHLLIVLEES